MNVHVISAIFKRNFVSYFSNPTGYVFITVFVFLSSLAAFWPEEFFNNNLANLDQLNRYLPYILLVFIPAITMSIWAEERRQGTDELLLTIPAGDFDVVVGKYLAAVAIYGVSLLFSLVCNWAVLSSLGNPDLGLIIGTYFGYFVVGLAMLSVGMAASFLTSNLTVGFVLGAMFNAPLVFSGLVPDWASWLRQWSIDDQFRDFSRGVISIASLTFFLSLVAVMLYASMVLIGRRHWRGGSDAEPMPMHYLTRFLCLLVLVVGLNIFLSKHNSARVDVTSEQLSSISPQTRALLSKIKNKTVQIDAYVSKDPPEDFVQDKLNLISTLREVQAAGGSKIQLHIHEMEPFSQAATRAEQQFGITPRRVASRSGGVRKEEELFMGLAVTSGLEKAVVPFIDKGIPIEYEVIRSIATVCDEKKKRIGVLTTDAKLYGGFDMQTMGSTPNQPIIDELQKQYDLTQVDPSNPITEKFDVLLAVQPSSLNPQQMDNFITAVKSGQPTAIFEDPVAVFASNVPGTDQPKQPPGGMNPFMQNRQPPEPKGDVKRLWDLLGVDFHGSDIVWQDYNPYRKMPDLMPEFVIVDRGSGAKEPFNEKNPITARVQQVLFPFPGYIKGKHSSQLTFTPLVSTSDRSGFVPFDKLFQPTMMGGMQLNPNLKYEQTGTTDNYIVAALITGKLKADAVPMSDKEPAADDDAKTETKPEETNAETATSESKPAEPAKPKDAEINVVLVSDIDCLMNVFFNIRAMGTDKDAPVDWKFDNVTFVLNVLDDLAKDDRFIEIRKRRPQHRTLDTIERRTEDAYKASQKAKQKFVQDRDEALKAEQKKFDDRINELKNRKNVNPRQALTEVAIAQQDGQRRLEMQTEKLKRELDSKVKLTEVNLAQQVRSTQDWFKLWSVLLPPIPPLIVAFFVFFNRREKEKAGVAKTRLRVK